MPSKEEKTEHGTAIIGDKRPKFDCAYCVYNESINYCALKVSNIDEHPCFKTTERRYFTDRINHTENAQ